MIKAAIFDVDGTLLDSMSVWMHAGERYLLSIGVEPTPGLAEEMWQLSFPEGAPYIKEKFGLSQTVEEINAGIEAKVMDFYKTEAKIKPGVLDFLKNLESKGIPMVVATSSDRSFLDIALKRVGIDGFFKNIITCREVGAGKTTPLIYEKCAEYMGSTPGETAVFEDVIHAVKSAKEGGFIVVGVADTYSAADRADIIANSDIFIEDFTEVDKLGDLFR